MTTAFNWTTVTEEVYKQTLYNHILDVEEGGNPKTKAYVDSEGILTIGIGFNLKNIESRNKVYEALLGANYGRDENKPYLTALEKVFNQTYTGVTGKDAITALDAIMKDRAADPNVAGTDKPTTFAFKDTAQIETTFKNLIPFYEETLDKKFSEAPPFSRERIGLMSLVYNLPTLVGAGIVDAINNNDRARAWAEALYHHANTDVNGLMNRREKEAAFIGLFEPNATVDDIRNVLDRLANGNFANGEKISDIIAQRSLYSPFGLMVESELKKSNLSVDLFKLAFNGLSADTQGLLDFMAFPALNELNGFLDPNFDPTFGGLLAPISQFGQSPMLTCPLILDLDGDGLEVTRMGYGASASEVYFDLDSDGFAERTGWVQQGTQDGFLAIDRNGNGKIDNESEMFCVTNSFANGFENLRSLDTNADGAITAADAQWNNLRVWVDANGDAVTDAGELKTLAELGITSIGVNSTPQTDTYINENLVTATSTFVMNGTTKTVSDIWFRNDDTDTRWTGECRLKSANDNHVQITGVPATLRAA